MKTPKIRFKGGNSRTEKFIKQIWKISTGKSNTQDQTEDWKYPFFIRSDIVVKSNKFLFNEEAVITIGDWNIWKVFHYINGKYDLHQRCYKISDFKDIFWKYFYYYFSTKFYKRAMSMTAKATVDSVRLEMISDMLIRFPSLPEQEKIWSLFEQLDSQITKNQQKLEKLQNMKQSFLQKLFPKAWATVPELRFKGFEGAWEERKLGEIFEEYSEKNHTELPVLTIMQWIWTMLRSEVNRNLQYNKNSVSNYKLVNKDDFIVHLRSFEWGLEKSNHTWIVSPAYHILHWENINPDFYYVFFRSFNFINKKLISHVYWIRDWKSIDIAWMKTINIPYTSLKEQEKIGNFIKKLDLQLTKQQEKIQKLQNIKQSLLEKMFI